MGHSTLLEQSTLEAYTIQIKYNTNKNSYSAVIHKNESEALVGPLGGKQVSFKFGFKGTVVSRDSDANRKNLMHYNNTKNTCV